MKVNFGAIKTWQVRLGSYMGIMSFIMIFYLFITENNWFEWYVWIILITLLVILIIVIDVIIVLPQQLEYNWLKNPEWMKHKKQINKKLDIIEKKIEQKF